MADLIVVAAAVSFAYALDGLEPALVIFAYFAFVLTLNYRSAKRKPIGFDLSTLS